MIRYKYDWDASRAKAVECAKVGHPHLDSDGEMQYDNTHFDTEREAWECGRQEARAGVGLALGDLRGLTAAKTKREQEVVDCARRQHAAEEWLARDTP